MPYKNAEKKKEYQKAWVAERRKQFLANKACNWCGSCEKLEIDHKDPGTKISHRMWSWSQERLLTELSKCQVLCHRCHKLKTAVDYASNKMHGAAGYSQGCRCTVCRAGRRDEGRKERKGKMGP